jgi:hypothetical protein
LLNRPASSRCSEVTRGIFHPIQAPQALQALQASLAQPGEASRLVFGEAAMFAALSYVLCLCLGSAVHGFLLYPPPTPTAPRVGFVATKYAAIWRWRFRLRLSRLDLRCLSNQFCTIARFKDYPRSEKGAKLGLHVNDGSHVSARDGRHYSWRWREIRWYPCTLCRRCT